MKNRKKIINIKKNKKQKNTKCIIQFCQGERSSIGVLVRVEMRCCFDLREISTFARNWETRLREEILRELKETLDETFEKNAFLLSRTTEFLIILDFWSGLTGFGGFFHQKP